jgi:hypothetical protein
MKRKIHKNHLPRLKELGRRCRQDLKIERRLQQTLQEVLLRGRTKLRKEEQE